MSKRKLTDEILELIEDLAFNGYSLEDIQEEADITKPLMEDAQIIEAIKKGRTKRIIEDAVKDDGNAARDFVESTGMTITEHKQIRDNNLDVIESKKSNIRAKKQENSKDVLDAAGRSGHNIFLQHDPANRERVHESHLADEISKVVKDLQRGDTSSLLEILVGNITQLHLFNGVLAMNLSGDENMTLDKMNKLSNMQLKVMQETRKSIMAINEITNPKRTTFVREANQYIHQNSEKLSENNSEKKDGCVNKLSRPKEEEIIDAHQYTEAETVTAREN